LGNNALKQKRDARVARLYKYEFMWVITGLGNNKMLLNSIFNFKYLPNNKSFKL